MEEGRSALRPAMATAALRRLLRCLLRASAEAREKAGNANGALGFTGERWGLMWRTTARRGLASQDVGDARPPTRQSKPETVGPVDSIS